MPSASFDPMSVPWQGEHDSNGRTNDDTQALGWIPGQQPGTLGLSSAAWPYDPAQEDFLSNQLRPALALDTSGPSFRPPHFQFPSTQSSIPASGIDFWPYHAGEQINTPQWYGLPGPGHAPPTPTYQWLPITGDPQSNGGAPPNPYAVPYPGGYPTPQQDTISPAQLGHHATLKPRSLMGVMDGSMSSTSSTEGGQDWSFNPNILDDWPRPLQRALVSEPNFQECVQNSYQPVTNDAKPWGPASYSTQHYGADQNLAQARDSMMKDYVSCPNRLAFGERKIVIMSPRVGQKSYGTEKRFLCPQPQAMLIGGGWWREISDDGPSTPLLPPIVNIGLSGEEPVSDALGSWTSGSGHNLDQAINSRRILLGDSPFLGNVAGRNLHISGVEKRREVKAVVTVRSPRQQFSGQQGPEAVSGKPTDIADDEFIGTFESKDIKVISKPSKKQSNSKSGELHIHNGTTISLTNRYKSHRTSTRYLSVTSDPTRILGTDGRPVFGAQSPTRPHTAGIFDAFIASDSVWGSFIIWLADPAKAPGPGTGPPLHADWPNAPANAAAPFMRGLAIRFNSTVILQSIHTGVCSPVLIVRRIQQDAEVIGADGTCADLSEYYVDGEMGGDLLQQLQKMALEVYGHGRRGGAGRDMRHGGTWMACDEDKVTERFLMADRRWMPVSANRKSGSRPNSVPSTPNQRFGVLPMTPHTSSTNLPSTPTSPVSTSSSLDYFGAHSRKQSSSSLMSSTGGDGPLPSSDGGPVRRPRTGSSGSRGPFARPTHRNRQSAEFSTSSSFDHLPNASGSPGEGSRMCWTLDVGDTCVWTIGSSEQITYTFYVPPHIPQITEPISPFPMAHRLLLPNAPVDVGSGPGRDRLASQYTSSSSLPLVTIYGKKFQKNSKDGPHHLIYYGDRPASYNEARCSEVMAAAEPSFPVSTRTPIFLVREDGQCVIPTPLTYPS